MEFFDKYDGNYRMRNKFVRRNTPISTNIKNYMVKDTYESVYDLERINRTIYRENPSKHIIHLNEHGSESSKSFESTKTYDLDSCFNKIYDDFHYHLKRNLAPVIASDISSNETKNRSIPDKVLFGNDELNYHQGKCNKSTNIAILTKNQSTQCIVEIDFGSMISIRSLQSVSRNKNIFERTQHLRSSPEHHVTFDDLEAVDTPSKPITSKTKLFAAKTTYCRPVLNLCSQEFIYNTLEKNARLQYLVQRLVKARKTERKNELSNRIRGSPGHDWELQQRENVQLKPVFAATPVRTDDYYSKLFPCEQRRDQNNARVSQDKNNILQEILPNSISYNPYKTFSYRSVPFLVNKMTSGTNYGLNIENKQSNRAYPVPLQMSSIDKTGTGFGECRNFFELKTTNLTNSRSSVLDKTKINPLTNSCKVPDFTKTNKENIKEKCNRVSQSCKNLKYELIESKTNNNLSNIESKLDNLVESIYTLIGEVKSRKLSNCSSKSYSSHGAVTGKKHNEDLIKSKLLGFNKTDDNITTNKAVPVEHSNNQINTEKAKKNKSRICESSISMNQNINKVLENSEKGNMSTEIKSYMPKNNKLESAVQITIDIHKKEIATEITDSLSTVMAQLRDQNVIPRAVNTEPLGILSLIKVSADAMRQLLSCVPNLDYYSYLPQMMIQGSDAQSSFVCNICGAPFDKPSQLGDHIGSHNLGATRDCCVCRHVVDLQQYRITLFRCKYCGQRFTRAYCCELHQYSCAKKLGANNDVTPSMVILS